MNAIITPKVAKPINFHPAVAATSNAAADPAAHLNSNVSAIDICPKLENIVRPTEFGLKLVTPELSPIAPDLGGMTILGADAHDEGAVGEIAEELGDSGGMKSDTFERYVESMTQLWSAQNAHTNVNSLVQEVLREAYLIQCDQLRDYASKVKFHNNQKEAIREQLNHARTMTFDEDGNRTSGALQAHTFEEAFSQPASPAAVSAANEQSPVNQEQELISAIALEASKELAQSVQVEDLKTIPGTTLHGTAHGQGSDIGDEGEDAIRAAAHRAYEEFEAYWRDLSDEQKIAFEEKMREEGGLTFSYSGEESDHNNTKTFGGSVPNLKLGEHETVAEYIKDSLERMADKLVQRYKNHKDGRLEGQADVGSVQLSIEIPPTKYDAAKIQNTLNVMPEQIARPQRSVALGGFGASGANEAEASWMEAGTIETETQRDDYVKALEDRLNSVGDDAQLANVDLQNCLQKQQQLISMMSNIAKTLHETAMSIIRKMGS